MLLLYIRSWLLLPLGFLHAAMFLEYRFRASHYDLLWLALMALVLGGGVRLWVGLTYLDSMTKGGGISRFQYAAWRVGVFVLDPMLALIGLLQLYLWVKRWVYLPQVSEELGLWSALVLGLCPAILFLFWRKYFPPSLELLHLHVPAPHPAKGLKLLFLSDLHLDNHPPSHVLDEIVGSLAAIDPDLILLGGDLVDHQPSALPNHQSFFKALRAQAPVITIFGNHDLLAGADECQQWLEDEGVIVLRDQWLTFEDRLSIFGSRDLYGENPVFTGPGEAQFPALLLAHNPDLLLRWPELEKQNYFLALSGHTHGGQIRLPLWGPLVTVSDPSFQPGFNDPGRGLPPLILSKGIGYAAVPVRIDCNPDIVLVDLV